jgi:sporulation protein YlmC with PRC-barrel domain
MFIRVHGTGGSAPETRADKRRRMVMAETTPFIIETEARCSDGVCGEVIRVVVDPVAQTVTHLVVEPKERRGLGRLVPLSLLDAMAAGIQLRCTVADFGTLDLAEETQFLPGSRSYAEYGPGQVSSWPYFGLAGAGVGSGMGIAGGMGIGLADVTQTVIFDRVPMGEVTVRRGEQVHANDGDIGFVQGLVIDTRDHHVTHVLLQEGHLWGRKQVAIPISSVASTSDGIQLKITKQEVQDLPPVNIDHPDDSAVRKMSCG